MKKFLKPLSTLAALTAAALLAVLLLAAGDCTMDETPIAKGQTGAIQSYEYTVQDVEIITVIPTPNMLTATTYSESGKAWICVTLRTKNVSAGLGSFVYASNISLSAGGSKYDVDTGTYTYYNGGNGKTAIEGKEKLGYMLATISITKGETTDILVLFKVPEGTTLSDAYVAVANGSNNIKLLLE